MLNETIQHLVDELTAAGVNAAADLRDLALPGVWVTADKINAYSLDGDHAAVTLTVVLISAGAPDRALADLDALVDQVSPGRPGLQEWEAVSIRANNHSTEPLPALRSSATYEWIRT